MCNRYRPASITYIRDAFGFTLIEDSYPPAIGPMQPFHRAWPRRGAVGADPLGFEDPQAEARGWPALGLSRPVERMD